MVIRMPRRYWHEHRAALFWFVCLLLILWRVYEITRRPASPEVLAEGAFDVGRAIDGDTIVLANGARIRLQGIDAPETVKPNHPVEPYGPEASAFTKQFLKRTGYRVRLTFSSERKDRYGRFLAFVWDGGDKMLNEELVRAGLARAKLGYRYSGIMKRRLAQAQDEARAAKRGIWSTKAAVKMRSGPISAVAR
jgi:micrococcal nuclease